MLGTPVPVCHMSMIFGVTFEALGLRVLNLDARNGKDVRLARNKARHYFEFVTRVSHKSV